ADPARLLRIVRHLAPRGRHPVAAQDLLRLILVNLQDMSPPGSSREREFETGIAPQGWRRRAGRSRAGVYRTQTATKPGSFRRSPSKVATASYPLARACSRIT